MKLTKLLAITALLLAVGEFRAAADVGLTLNLTANLLVQSTNSFTNARTQAITVGAPRHVVITTGDLLRRLAIDENIINAWPSNTFPRGSRLVATNDTFVVMRGTNVLVDVSNVISFSGGNNQIFSGTTDTNGLARPITVKTHLARIDINDSGINSTNAVNFYLQGVMTETMTDTAPNRNGVFIETQTAIMTGAAGEGSIGIGSGDEREVISTGSVTAIGAGRIILN